jgi:hypothetical protein
VGNVSAQPTQAMVTNSQPVQQQAVPQQQGQSDDLPFN